MENEASNSIADGWSPIGGHQIKVTLKPGEKHHLNFVLGYVENEPHKKWEEPGVINKEIAIEMIQAFDTPRKAKEQLDDLKAYWNSC